MSRILWLVFERVPHPEAVSFPALDDDARFVLELLAMPRLERTRYAGQLRNYLGREQQRARRYRDAVPCRRPSGLYQVVPRRLAKWLANILAAEDAVIEQTATRIRAWLEDSSINERINPVSVS